MTQPAMQQIDKPVTIEREKAMRVRNAYLALLRAFEDMYDLPRSVETKSDRKFEGVAIPSPSTPIQDALDYFLSRNVITATERADLRTLPPDIINLGLLLTALKQGQIEFESVRKKLIRFLG